MAKELTDHQKRALAALVLIEGSGRLSGEPASRTDIGSIVFDSCQGVQLATMLALQAAGFVEAESDEAIKLVQSQVCRCGCDRWRPTKLGIDYIAKIKVRFGEHGQWMLKHFGSDV